MHVKNVVIAKQQTGLLAEIFLPKGYPASVSDDYIAYQFWDSAQALCSSVMGALSANAVFKGIGVGDEGASALSATTNWILRQGLGKCASITFAYRSGAAIGTDSKRYRLLADIVNDCALTINLLSAHVSPSIRPYIYACSSVCWAIVGIAGSCTRTALTIHQARANNAADVQAKDQSQETLVELLGLAVSYFIVSLIGNHPIAVLVLFAIFIALHLTCNYTAVKCVTQATLNLTRARLMLQRFKGSHSLPSVAELNQLEPVILKHRTKFTITLGAKWHDKLDVVETSDEYIIGMKGTNINVCLTEAATDDDVFDAMMIAVMKEHEIERNELDDIKGRMKAIGYSFSADHLVVEKYRVAFNK